MQVRIHLPLPWRKFTGSTGMVEVKGNTVGQCLQDMFQKFPALQGTVPPTGFELHINGEKVFSWQSDREVQDGDDLIISSISGCC